MPNVTEGKKQGKMERVFLKVKGHSPRGITTKEISKDTGISVRLVNYYLDAMKDEGKVEKDQKLWRVTNYEETRLLKVELSPEEAYTLYIGSRLLVKQYDKRNELAEAALLKLADKLVSDAEIGREIAQAAAELAQRPRNPAYQAIFETMVRSYLQRQRVKIRYKPLDRAAFETLFDIYLIEPSAIGYSTYVIGKSHIVNELRAYKLERIQAVEDSSVKYSIDADFPGLEILRNSWSIVLGEKTIKVVLRFSPDVKARVLETRWHALQEEPIDDPEKSDWLRWTVHVSDTLDMEPWIRGWGADCEVLEPKKLHKKLVRESLELARLYKLLEERAVPNHWLLWAKTNRPKNTQFHLLICHLIDVGQVALAMWQIVFTQSLKTEIATALNLEIEAAGQLIAFLAALHDLGKACPSFQGHPNFQRYFATQFTKIEAAFPFAKQWEPCSHAYISALELKPLLTSRLAADNELSDLLARAIGGHHGRWPTMNELDGYEDKPSIVGEITPGDHRWRNVRVSLFEEIYKIFTPPQLSKKKADTLSRNKLLILLSGLVSVADWIGSIAERFGYEERINSAADLREYIQESAEIARTALEELGWTEWQAPTTSATFAEQFEGKQPRDSQREMINLVEQMNEPSIVIVEDAAGNGKTEVAFYYADYWSRTLGNRGIYVAMPTKATSNEMHKRMTKILGDRYGEATKPLLVHSQARWSKDVEVVKSIGDDEFIVSKKAGLNATAWFADDRKRSLLAAFGVGTVDQTFMSVLQSNHFFVRLFALSRKTIIFDEVHAYDTYMLAIFERLLFWLRLVDASVIILSATLPNVMRQRFVAAYGGDPKHLPAITYPRLTWVTGSSAPQAVRLTRPAVLKSVRLTWIDPSPEKIAIEIKERMKQGGCIAIICNRIARAQDIYLAICALNRLEQWISEDDIYLFHARIPMAWRNRIEEDVRNQFDKSTPAPRRPAIVVATQVIEQSLDLDFDLMVTDLPPIDLLIQRVGRLHRHAERNTDRPVSLMPEQLLIAKPKIKNNVPDFGYDELVYSPYVLLRSWWEVNQLIEHQKALEPLGEEAASGLTETERLIESVYQEYDLKQPPAFTEFPPELQTALSKAWQKMLDKEGKDEYDARSNLVCEPTEDVLKRRYLSLPDEDDPALQESMRNLTRKQTLPSIQLICIYVTSAGDTLDEKGQMPIKLTGKKAPDNTETRRIIANSVQVSGWKVWKHFQGVDAPTNWQEHALLRHYRVAKFTKQDRKWLCALSDGNALGLHPKLGIVIHGPSRDEDEE